LSSVISLQISPHFSERPSKRLLGGTYARFGKYRLA
jgi:hypothetical protein